MRLAAAALVLALALPGCAIPAKDVQPAGVVDAASALRFTLPKPMEQPTAGAEPNIAVGTDGTLFVTAVAGSQERPNAMEGAAWLWRSKDGGGTWQTLRAPQRDTPLGSLPMTRKPFGSSDADVTTSADGWTYYTDWWNWGAPVAGTPRYGSYLVEASGDGGASWSSAPVTTLDSAGGVDRQWIVAMDKGNVGLFYAYFHGAQNAIRSLGDPFGRGDSLMSIQAVFSRDHAASWSSPITIVPPKSNADYQIAHPRWLGNGTIVMPYGEVDYQGSDEFKDPSHVRLAVSRDNGTTWRSRLVADAPQGFDNLWAVQGAAGDAGTVYVAWAARTGATMTVFVSESKDLGDSWTTPLALTTGGLNFLPWVAARADGRVAVGWYGGNATGEPEKAPADAKWFPYVAVRDAPGQPFRVAKLSDEPVKTGPLCPKGAACGTDREILDYLSLAFGPDGRLHAAFAKSREVAGAKAGLVEYVGASQP